MKFKTFKFMYLLSYQASIWLILAIGYFDINRFFSIFSAFLAIVGAICTAVLYQKISKLETCYLLLLHYMFYLMTTK